MISNLDIFVVLISLTVLSQNGYRIEKFLLINPDVRI